MGSEHKKPTPLKLVLSLGLIRVDQMLARLLLRDMTTRVSVAMLPTKPGMVTDSNPLKL